MSPSPRQAPAAATLTGEVIATHGRHYLIEMPDGSLRACVTRGKRSDLACGDQVRILPQGDEGGVVEQTLTRSSLYARSAEHRTKLLAANVTQLLVMVATEPSFSDELVTRAAVAAHHEGLQTLVVLNKCDLPGVEQARVRLRPLERAGIMVVPLVARTDASVLLPHLIGQRTVLVGQSGMGKSTLINALVPEANSATGAISTFLDSGRHTTTTSRLYRLDERSSLIDTPGLQAFGLAHLPLELIAHGFPELADWHGTCRFSNCSHRSEPNCGYRAALAAGAIHPRRFELLLRLLEIEGKARRGPG
jgi:ribosome biogenesis GTPase